LVTRRMSPVGWERQNTGKKSNSGRGKKKKRQPNILRGVKRTRNKSEGRL